LLRAFAIISTTTDSISSADWSFDDEISLDYTFSAFNIAFTAALIPFSVPLCLIMYGKLATIYFNTLESISMVGKNPTRVHNKSKNLSCIKEAFKIFTIVSISYFIPEKSTSEILAKI
jgi:hypothetical protein